MPERLELKQKVYQTPRACRRGRNHRVVTSGFNLQNCRLRDAAEQIGHAPVQPGLPTAAGGTGDYDRNTAELIESAKETLTGIGMYPLHVKKEIDAHIADRFLEAVWREALWLVKDGIATTEEIDNAIRYGFGIRWAQMGLFETYRVAGGEAGMKHFMAQFGPALKWPGRS